MREIKFRGLDYYGKWQYGNYEKKFLPSRDWTGKTTSEPSWVHYITDYEYGLLGVHSETVGQFTGFKDKNGNEIYEGDKLRWQSTDIDGSLIQQEDKVFFEDGQFMVGREDEPLCEYLKHDYDKIEVIGNIHESEDAK